MPDVYVLTENELSEGGSVLGVYPTLDAALDAGAVHAGSYRWRTPGEWTHAEGEPWELAYTAIDYVMVERFTVEEGE